MIRANDPLSRAAAPSLSHGEAPSHGEAAPLSLVLLCDALFACGAVVVLMTTFGFTGHLNASILPIALSLLAIGARRAWGAPARRAATSTSSFTLVEIGLLMSLIVLLGHRLWTGLHASTYLYDVLSYHLHIPASWRAANRIDVIPTPFGDRAPAYAPANAELFYALAMMATADARLAQTGQVIFLGLACLALHATARAAGATRATALGAAIVFAVIPEIYTQAATAMADLAVAAFFLSTLPFVIRLAMKARADREEIAALAVACGLLLGTKYLGVILFVALIPAFVIAVARRRFERSRTNLTTLLGGGIAVSIAMLATGGFWYVRNFALTGNPMFPVAVEFGPWTLSRGLYGRHAMRAWDYHLPVSNLRPLWEFFSETTFVFQGWIGMGIVVAGFAVFRANRDPGNTTTSRVRTANLALALTLILTLCLGWFVVPYQQSRFFFATWGTAAALVAIQVGRHARWLASTQQVISEHGIIRRYALLSLLLLLATTIVGVRQIPGDAGPYAIGDEHDDAWEWVKVNVHQARIAYAGSNLPFPLWGATLENVVCYVPVVPLRESALHTQRRSAPHSDASAESAEPAPDRAHPNFGRWMENLERDRIDVVFVAALYPIVQRSEAHDADNFPPERAWADSHPQRFALAFANAGIRIYRVRPANVKG